LGTVPKKKTNLMPILLNEKPKKFDGLWLSVSSIKTFEQCPARYKFHYIDRIPVKQWEHFAFGKFLHGILENFHKELMHGNSSPINEIMGKVFSGVSKSEPFKKELTKEQKDESFKILQSYLVKLKDGIPDVNEVEFSFYVDFEGEALLTGSIDRIQTDPDGSIHVLDYKTTKNKKYLAKDHFQLLSYAYVMCLADETIESIKTSYILLKHNFEYITKTFDRKKIMEMKNTFIDWTKEIKSEKLWRPKPTFLCKYCDYSDRCSSGRDYLNRVNNKTNTNFGEQDW